MLSAKEKLLKFISLEINRGCDNRAVVGGMIRFLPIWNQESGGDELSPEEDEAVRAYLNGYEEMDREAREAAGLALSERLGSPVSKKASSPRPKPAQSRPRSDGARFDERRERTDRPPRFQVRKIRFDDLSVNSEMLEKPVSVIPGIGPQNSRSMAKQGIYTVRDFLYYFPRRYDDYSTFKKSREIGRASCRERV